MGKTVNDFCEYLNSRVGSLYVLGMQGHSVKGFARAAITEYEKRYSSQPERSIERDFAQLDKKLPEDIFFYDCSGLGVAWLIESGLIKQDYTANSMYTQLCTKINRAALKKGDWVFVRNPNTGNITHIGYVVDHDLYVVEAKGRDDGVVKRPLSAGGWNVYGRPDKIFPELNQSVTISRVLRLTSPYMRGDDVRALQESVRGIGITVDVDGIFGPGTESAVRIAQEQLFPNNPSEWDGQAGKKTAEALGLTWAV
ncbi:MAG: peptidoglycan-binding protein [Lachnospiraceae bacterium]|nr:peptidoglycan-binding protein [Lachnospiraceae bacterium]